MKAYRQLKAIWERAIPIGPAVDAFDEIERRLANDPAQEGESRAAGRRIMHVTPLGVIFRVNERLREVHILDAWMFDVHKQDGAEVWH